MFFCTPLSMKQNDYLVQKFLIDVSSASDYVHDVTHNYYGLRLAICTSAQQVSVWDKHNGNWVLGSTINLAHNGPIWRLDWAHPEYGQVLASCSEDKAISIWSEKVGASGEQWKKRATLTDASLAVTDVQFSSKCFGLKLASCSSDGNVRIYNAPDPLNLAYWEVEDFAVTKGSSDQGCTALSWSPCNETERIAICTTSGYLKIFEKNKRWILTSEKQILKDVALKDCAWSPNLCRKADWIAACGLSEEVEILSFIPSTHSLQLMCRINTGSSPLWRVSWNLTGNCLAVAPEKGHVQLWKLKGIQGHDWIKVNSDDS
jgi:nucleoporin SEH1